jgi:hypothetical protein
MSSTGQKWARDNYCWPDIARAWVDKFQKLLADKEK